LKKRLGALRVDLDVLAKIVHAFDGNRTLGVYPIVFLFID
jgi:hypothetical protein